MTAERWLAERDPQPPAELASSLASSLVASLAAPGGASAEVARQLVSAARNLTPRVLAAAGADRSGALDLLTLDALITYAMEAGSATSAQCERTAADLLSVIGEVQVRAGQDTVALLDPSVPAE